MSDVVAAALIAASVGVIGNATTAYVALTTGRRQTKADADRLHAEHRQDDRRLRREVYARLLLELEALDLLVTHDTRAVTREDFDAWLRAYRAANVHVRLIESGPVKAARDAVSEVIGQLGEDVSRRAARGQPMHDALRTPYLERRSRMFDVARELGNAMSTDLELVRP